MNSIEKELSESVFKAIVEEDRESARVYYNRYKTYYEALKLSADKELFLNVDSQYKGFIKSFEGDKE